MSCILVIQTYLMLQSTTNYDQTTVWSYCIWFLPHQWYFCHSWVLYTFWGWEYYLRNCYCIDLAGWLYALLCLILSAAHITFSTLKLLTSVNVYLFIEVLKDSLSKFVVHWTQAYLSVLPEKKMFCQCWTFFVNVLNCAFLLCTAMIKSSCTAAAFVCNCFEALREVLLLFFLEP